MKSLPIVAHNVTKRFSKVTALDSVSFSLQPNTVCGLLGRNGAGKTTLMACISTVDFFTSGDIRVFGESPIENPRALRRMSYISEDQTYPPEATPKTIFATARLFYRGWDQELAMRVASDLNLPLSTNARKLSRGQRSALGITVGLASNAPITFFDEPHLGLDAVARPIFYRHLARQQEINPRTIIVSSHLIDEISTLIDQVLLLDKGRLILDSPLEEIADNAFTIVGPTALLEDYLQDLRVLERENLGGTTRALVFSPLSETQLDALDSAGFSIAQTPLQELTAAMMGEAR